MLCNISLHIVFISSVCSKTTYMGAYSHTDIRFYITTYLCIMYTYHILYYLYAECAGERYCKYAIKVGTYLVPTEQGTIKHYLRILLKNSFFHAVQFR